MKNIILGYAPRLAQNLAISIYNARLYSRRHGGDYVALRQYFQKYESAGEDGVTAEHRRRLKAFLAYATSHSAWYAPYKGLSLDEFPVLEKRDLVESANKIFTLNERDAMVSMTGGTTGASLKVLYEPYDIQERFAIIDHFRNQYGYDLGKRTAWFSGKSLLRQKDLDKGIVFRDDLINKIRFLSTFHVAERYFDAYWKALTDFAPQFLVGFPSSVHDICAMALERGLSYPGIVKAFFCTAESILPHHREVIGRVLGCRLIDQYASSEGAPFILECASGGLHIQPLTGVFEVVDEEMEPVDEGELLVTSFTTHGTPLIRYRIGDRIKLASKHYRCPCGSPNRVVDYIDGRTQEFLWSPENGRVNLGNLSNCTKGTRGITCFQVVQDKLDEIEVRIVAGKHFDGAERDKFVGALRERVGSQMSINVDMVNDISREHSGKFRIVKNNLRQDEMVLRSK